MSTSTGSAVPHGIAKHLALKDGVNVVTLAADLTLTLAHGNSLQLDPGGADRVVTLPAEAISNGAWFEVKNTGSVGEDLSIKDDAAATIRVLNAGECCVVRCDGTSWYDTTPSGLTTLASLDDNGYLYGGLDNDWYLHHDNDKGLEIGIADNDATALVILQGADNYLVVDTRNGTEIVSIGNAVTNPDFSVLGSGQITLTGNVDCSTGLDVAGGALTFTGTNYDLDPTGTYNLSMDAGQAYVVAIAGAASNITLTASGAGHDFTLAVAGAVDASLVLSSAGTGADALQVTASAGGMDITAAGDLDIVGTTSADFGDGTGAVHYAAGALSLTGTTTIDLDGSGAVSLESSAGAINVGADAVAQAVNIATGAAARAILIGNAASASLGLEAGVGALTVNADAASTMTFGATLAVTSAGGSSSWVHTAALAAQDLTVQVAGAVDASLHLLSAGTGADAITLAASAGGLQIDAAGALTIESSAGALSIGADAVAQPLNLGTGGARPIQIGSAAAASCYLDGGIGALRLDCAVALEINCSADSINIGNDAVAQPVNIATGAAARVITIGNAASASLALEGGVGAVLIDADTTIELNSSGGAILVGNDNIAQAITIGGAGARAITVGSAAAASLTLEGGVGAVLIDADTTVEINSSAGALSIGNDAVAQPVNIATGAAARVITIGNAASASLTLEGGVGAVLIDADTTVEINSSGGALSVGNDAVAQALNLGTGGARAITIGSAAAASLALDAGIGAFSVLTDTTLDLDSAGALSLNSSGAAINVGNDAVAQAINVGTGAAARTITIGNVTGATAIVLNAGSGAVQANGFKSRQSVTELVDDVLDAAGSPYTLTIADSGGTFLLDQAGAVAITLPDPTAAATKGAHFRFVVLTAGANNITIADGAAGSLFIGTIVNDVTSVIPATGTTLTIVSGVAAVGDSVDVYATGGVWCVRAVTSTAGGITIA